MGSRNPERAFDSCSFVRFVDHRISEAHRCYVWAQFPIQLRLDMSWIRPNCIPAVRLGLIGSLQAQRLHRRHSDEAESLLRARAGRIGAGHAAAERAAPMIDLGQASHPYLYSKLFQS